MNKRLNRKDYENVLSYYKIPFTSSTNLKDIKNKASKILSEKLCKCINKTNTKSKSNNNTKNKYSNYALCTKSVLHNKNLTYKKFTCKGKKPSITLRKKMLNNFKKTMKK